MRVPARQAWLWCARERLRIIDRAEKRVGEKLIEAKESGEVASRADGPAIRDHVEGNDKVTLTDLGITRDQSADWQRRARTPDPLGGAPAERIWRQRARRRQDG